MPTYDYRCPNGHEFEHFVRKISDGTAELVCPTCGAVAQRRVSGGAGLVFKGSGFYLTDYGKNAHRAPVSSKGDGAGDGKSDGKGDGKSEGPKSDSGASASSGASTSSSDAAGGKSAAKSESTQSSERTPSPTKKSKGGDAQ